ncbi:MAG: hypothetical protein WCK75_05800 [Elusimicrobiota bacterium]
MRKSPITVLVKTPWWINLLIGLGMLSFGSILKMDDIPGASAGKFAFGQSVQFFSIFFIGLAAASFLLAFYRQFFGKWMQLAETAPAPMQDAPPPPPPPPPKKRKYTDRDFMPPVLQAEFDAKEAGRGQLPEPPPAPTIPNE